MENVTKVYMVIVGTAWSFSRKLPDLDSTKMGIENDFILAINLAILKQISKC